MIRKLSFINKIYIIIAIIAMIILAVSMFTYSKFSNTLSILTETTKPDYESIRIQTVLNRLNKIDNNAKSYVITQSKDYLKNFKSNVKELKLKSKKIITDFSSNTNLLVLDTLINNKINVLNQLILTQDLKENTDGLSNIIREINSNNKSDKNKIWNKIFHSKNKVNKDEVERIVNNVKNNETLIKDTLITHEIKLLSEDKNISNKITDFISRFEIKEKEKLLNNASANSYAIESSRVILISSSILILIMLIILMIIIIRYVNSNKSYKLALQKEKEYAEKLARTKEQFLATMSHEIRTPMNAVTGFIEQIALGPLNEEQRSQIEIVQKSSEDLLYIINDILSLSKIESGKLKLEKTSFNITETIHDLKNSTTSLLRNKPVTLNVNIDTKNDIVIGDPYRIKQILLNLLGNAIKFTHKGSITLSLKELKPNIDKTNMLFKITDTGIGMTPEQLDKVFNTYEQGETKTERAYGGTGLGLSITKRLIDLHDGSLTVKSKKNEGTTIEILISYPISKKAEIPTEKQQPVNKKLLQDKTILIVDDEPFNRQLLEAILNKKNIHTLTATNGIEAIEQVNNYHIDLILMDNYMPQMNGTEASIKIRELKDDTKNNIPIIVISAAVENNDVSNYMSAGVNGFIAKPFKELDVLYKIEQVFEGKNSFEPKGKHKNEKPSNKIDFDNLKKLCNNDQDFYTDMLNTFIESTSESSLALKKKLARKDTESIAKIAHKMKATFGHLEAFGIMNNLSAIEKNCKIDKPIHIIKVLVDDTLDQVNETVNLAKQELNTVQDG